MKGGNIFNDAPAFVCVCPTNWNLSLSLSNNKYFNVAYCFLWVNICHAIEGTLIPKYKAIVVIYYAAQRQLAWATFGIKSL